MGRVVSGGRAQAVVGRVAALATHKWARRSHEVGKGGPKVAAYGLAGDTMDADLHTVRTHFGLNVSNAFRVSLHLVANAIREGRMNP